jgi:phosphatidylcholine synthase
MGKMNTPAKPAMIEVLAATAVHIFTATGAALGLSALLAASEGRWAASFAWLGLALFVDSADGPLARRFEVKRVLPRFSGEDLDKIVDYLTYVTVPAFMVARAPIVPQGFGVPLAALIMLVSLYHFSDHESKTAEGYFVGFPAIWNAVVLYCFVMAIPAAVSALLIGACALLAFVPFRYVHPLRVRRLRPITLAVIAAWGIAAITAVARGFPGSALEQAIFLVSAFYLAAIGLSARE